MSVLEGLKLSRRVKSKNPGGDGASSARVRPPAEDEAVVQASHLAPRGDKVFPPKLPEQRPRDNPPAPERFRQAGGLPSLTPATRPSPEATAPPRRKAAA